MSQTTIENLVRDVQREFDKNPEVYGTVLLTYHEELDSKFKIDKELLGRVLGIRRHGGPKTDKERELVENRKNSAMLAVLRDLLLYVMSCGTPEEAAEDLENMAKGVALGMKLADDRGLLDKLKERQKQKYESALTGSTG